jgi:hypothetical protein
LPLALLLAVVVIAFALLAWWVAQIASDLNDADQRIAELQRHVVELQRTP